MPSWKGKTRGGVLGYKIFIFTLKIFGLPFAYFILRFVAAYFFLFSRQSFKNIFSLYRNILNYSYFKSISLVYRNYFTFGKVILDKIALLSGLTNRFTFDFDGEVHLHNMAKNKTGGFLIGAHLGNWEIAGHLLKRIDAKINIVMYDEEHQRIKQMLQGIYEETVVNIIPIKDDFSHIYLINSAIENKEIICIHGDRFLEGTKTATINFLGKDALFPTGPFYLAQKFNVPVTFVYAIKETNKHYHFYATEPKVYSHSGGLKARNEAVNQLISDYALTLEKMLKAYPDHWFNYYDFWKK